MSASPSSVRFEFPLTQTSHIVAFICALAIGVVVSPLNVLEAGEGTVQAVFRVAHLAAFSGWFGTQLWVTFFAGLTMFKNLPRHTFGFIQSKLFPKYFLLGTILGSITMVTFLIEHPIGKWEMKEKIQGAILFCSLLTVLANLFYIEPSTTKVVFELHKMEKKLGAGNQPGKIESEKLVELKKDPQYNILYGRFYWLHVAATLGNLLSFGAQGIHLVYLSFNISSL